MTIFQFLLPAMRASTRTAIRRGIERGERLAKALGAAGHRDVLPRWSP